GGRRSGSAGATGCKAVPRRERISPRRRGLQGARRRQLLVRAYRCPDRGRLSDGPGGDDEDVSGGVAVSGACGQEARADSELALVLSVWISPLMPCVRRIAANSERRVANSLIVPPR